MAWVAVKFGINTRVLYWNWDKFHEVKPSQTTYFQCNKSCVYIKFSLLYPCYSILIPYSLTFVGVSMYAIYVQITLIKHMSHLVVLTVTQILANEIVITTF